MRNPERLRAARAALLLTAMIAVAGLVVACGGPERAPRQPITGVDRPPDQRPPNPHDEPATPTEAPPVAAPQPQPAVPAEAPPEAAAQPQPAPAMPEQPTAPDTTGRRPLLIPFVDEIVRTVGKKPGIVAVFPALSPQPAGPGLHVNGLGQRLADSIAEELRMAGVNPLEGEELRNDILASNRGLAEFRNAADVFWLAERIGAEYAVYGTVQKRVYERIKRDEQLELNLQCMQVSNRTPVARLRKTFTGGTVARDYYRDYTQPSDWKIGTEAPPFEPSVDAEVKFNAISLVRRILAERGDKLKGKRIAIDPAQIRSVSGPGAGELESMTTGFVRSFEKAEREAAAAGSTNPEVAALDKGPVTRHEEQYATLGAALEAIERRRAALRTSPAGQLSIDISRLLAEMFAKGGGDAFEVLADDTSRRGVLELIRREARAATEEGAMDPATIAELRARGAQVLVRATLRPFMRSYQLRILALDTGTGALLANESIDFEARFKTALDELTTK